MTQIEAGYVAQGYELPQGWTFERVQRERDRCPQLREIDVPVAVSGGVVAWSVPHLNGKAMSHGPYCPYPRPKDYPAKGYRYAEVRP